MWDDDEQPTFQIGPFLIEWDPYWWNRFIIRLHLRKPVSRLPRPAEYTEFLAQLEANYQSACRDSGTVVSTTIHIPSGDC